MNICTYCQKECKIFGLGSHQAKCPKNPNKNIHPKLGKIGKNQFSKAKEMGLSIPKCSEISRQKLIIRNKSKIWTEVERENHSVIMKNVVLRNPKSYSSENVSGRVKTYIHNGVKLKGKWELEVAKWLDSLSIIWQQIEKPFPYYWNEKWHSYFPDFYIPSYDIYIEVKGFKRERDDCKWNDFPHKLVVINKDSIYNLPETLEKCVELNLYSGFVA